jgi:L-lysine exporter family protein LysE/ArgO
MAADIRRSTRVPFKLTMHVYVGADPHQSTTNLEVHSRPIVPARFLGRLVRRDMTVVSAPSALNVAKFGGALFLVGYGLLAARRAWRPSSLSPSEKAPARLIEVLVTCAALTFLNPHVYLDTVVLLGALANAHRDERWLFGVGAVTASAVWFVGLGLGARRLAGLFASPLTWRILDALIAIMMIGLGVSLSVS